MRLYLPDNLLKRADADFSDLTASAQTCAAYWDPEVLDVLVIPFDVEPTEAEQEAIRRRLVTADAAAEQHYADLLAMRENATPGSFEALWLDTELAKYQPADSPNGA